MSLLFWFPFTQDLQNKGTYQTSIINNGASLSDSEGKIGSSYYFSGSSQYIQFNVPIDMFINDFTLSVWLKPTDLTRGVILGDHAASGQRNINIELTATLAVRIWWANSPDYISPRVILTQNEWNHLVIIKEEAHLQFYLNGVLSDDFTGTLSSIAGTADMRIGDDYRGGTTVSYQGYINDFRFYDYVLSKTEINQLTKCLVIHYKMDEIYQGQTIIDSSGYERNATIKSNISISTDTPKYSNSIAVNAGYATGVTNALGININYPEFTWSYWIKRTYTDAAVRNIYSGGGMRLYLHSDFKPRITWRHATSSSSANNTWAPNSAAALVPLNTWTYIAFTFKDGLLKFYLNGTYLISSNRTSTGQYVKALSSSYFLFGTANSANSWIGNVSDLRIYTIALTDDDIAELYHTGLKIDNLGNAHAGVFVEDEAIQVGYKNTKIAELHEDNNKLTSFYPSGELHAENIIEY